MSLFEWSAVAVTLTAVWLTTRQIVWCWPVGLVSVSMYAWVFYQAKLYADMGLQGIYFALSIYGWWAWLHGGTDDSELRVNTASWRLRALLFAIGMISSVSLGWMLSRWTDASLPFMDSALTCFSLVAQWLMTRKLLESWIVWIAVDVFYVGMFTYKELYPTAGLYAAFLVLATLGYVEWKRSMTEATA